MSFNLLTYFKPYANSSYEIDVDCRDDYFDICISNFGWVLNVLVNWTFW